jgi:hypothetical protein
MLIVKWLATNWKDLIAAVQSAVTTLSIIVGGIWVYLKYIRQQERYPNIEFSADLNFIGKQGDWWIVEIIARIENKGKAQHRMNEFAFELDGIYANDSIEINERWRNQVDFRHSLAKGSFLPANLKYFFIDPGVNSTYSFIVRVPSETTFLILHCWFSYTGRNRTGHVAEKTVKVP